MKELGIEKYEFFKAVDGKKMDLKQLKEQGLVHKDVKLTRGEIGCALSHVYVWKEIVLGGLDKALICEDDAIFPDNIHKIATLAFRDMPNDWDIIHWFTSSPVKEGRKHIKGNVYKGYTEDSGAVCYSVTRRGAEYLMTIGVPVQRPTDFSTRWLTAWWVEDYTGYVILPTPLSVDRNYRVIIEAVDI